MLSAIFGKKKPEKKAFAPPANSPLVSQTAKPAAPINKQTISAKKRRSRLDAAIDGE